jgi:hypothetical protein
MAKVIVKFLTGEEKIGNVMSFNINQPTFSLQIEKEGGKSELHTVRIDSVEAIHFLKKEEPSGSLLRKETIDQSIYAGTMALKLMIEFKDGKLMHGTTLKYDPNDKGFFLIPLNPSDRSIRIYVNAQAVENVDQKVLVGRILVDQKKINPKQLEDSLGLQKEIREKRIGTILKEEAIINEEQLQESLQKQRTKYKLLGEILLGAGYITPEQLQHALLIQQKNRKKRLGQILVELKYVTSNDICIALATQFHCPWIDLSSVRIPSGIATSLPEEVVRRLKVIPVERKGESILVVATSKLEDPDIGLEISKIIHSKVELVIAYEEYIESAINYYFPAKV